MIAPVSFLNKYLSSITAGQNIMDLGDANASITLVNLTQTNLSFALDPKRNSLYRCTSTTSDGGAIITIPTIWETAESQFDGRSFGVLFLLHHAGSTNDAAQTNITVRSEKQGRTIATLRVGTVLALQYSSSNRLNASVSPTENIPVSTGYIIYNVAGRGLPSNGEEGDLLVLNEDGEAIWQSPFSTNGMLPQDGEPGEILVRTADGAGWEALPEDELPPGGDAGDVLTRTDAGSVWSNLPDEELPPGGDPGDILTRTADGSAWSSAPNELPAGGDALQVLTRTATGYVWSDKFPNGTRDQFLGTNFNGDVAFRNLPNQLPTGGTSGQVLTRTATGYEWGAIEAAPDELPAGGESGDILTRTADGSEWSPAPVEIPTDGTTTQVLTRTAGGYEWRNVFPTGTGGQALITNFAGVPAFRNIPVELPPGGDEGQVLTRVGSGGRQWADLPDAGESQGSEGNPKLQIRTFQNTAGESFPTTVGDYTLTVDGTDTIIRIGFAFSEENLSINLRDDAREINVFREGQPNARFAVEQATKHSLLHPLIADDDTTTPQIRILEVRTATSNLPTWLSTPGNTSFFVYGENNDTAVDAEEVGAQARISSLGDLNFIYRFNADATNVDGPEDNGELRANIFNGTRNLVFLPDDAAYDRIHEASIEGRLDTITLRANAIGNRDMIEAGDLSSISRTDTYAIDVIEFPANRAASGNRIDVRIRTTFDDTWSNRRQTRFFVLNFNVLTPALSSSFATYRYLKVSRDLASATDRVVNVGLGSTELGGGGVKFSANEDERTALRALNYQLGDNVVLIGFDSNDVHIPGAYLKWDTFVLTIEDDAGTATLVAPSGLPAPFGTPPDKVSIHLFPGSAARTTAALQSLFQADNPFEFTWIVRKDGMNPVRGLKQIRWQPNFLRWSKEGNSGDTLRNSEFEEGDDVTLSAYNAQGEWLSNFTLTWNTHTSLDTNSNSEYIELTQIGDDRPLNNTIIRAGTYIKIRFHPGSKKSREQNLLVNQSGLFYQGKRLEQAPTDAVPGIFPDAANRTITHNIGDYERRRIIEENLGEGDLIELASLDINYNRVSREFKHLASAPDLSVDGVVSLTFVASDPDLTAGFRQSMNLEIVLSKKDSEGEAPLETFRTTTTTRTSVSNGDADVPGTYGFFNPANFGADDINRVMQLIEPISELGVYQTELENINRVEFRTEGATPEIYEFIRPPFITNSNGPDGQVTYIQFFFNRVVHANFRDATSPVFLTFLGEEDLRARNEITALTTRVNTNQAEIQTNATAASANALAIAANTTAIAAGTGTTDNIAHIFSRSDVLHIVLPRVVGVPSETSQGIRLSSSAARWYASPDDRAIVLGLGFVEGDTLIIEGRDANNSPVGSVACSANSGIIESTGFVRVGCDTTIIPAAIQTAAFISLTLIPSRGIDTAIAALEPKVESLESNTRNLPLQNEFTNSFRLLPKVSATTFDSLLGEQNTARWNSDGTALQFRTADNEEDGFFDYLRTIAGSDTAFKNVVATLLVGSELHRFDLIIDSSATGNGWGGEGSSTIIQFTARNDGVSPSITDITTSVGVISIQFSVAKKISKVLTNLANGFTRRLVYSGGAGSTVSDIRTLDDGYMGRPELLYSSTGGEAGGNGESYLFPWRIGTHSYAAGDNHINVLSATTFNGPGGTWSIHAYDKFFDPEDV